MKISKSSLVLTAAFTGLLGGTVARAATSTGAITASSAISPIAGQAADDKVEKHACKGLNSCKGQGRLQVERQRLQGQELVQGQGRLRHRRFQEVTEPAWGATNDLRFRAIQSMPANRFNGHTDYGIGIGLRVPHYQHILERKPVVDWFEIISENYMIDGGRPLAILDRILEQYRVVQHGVSMYFGSAEPLNREHLRRLKALVKRTKTPWLTDHLCWGSVDGRYTHDLLPMPYTFEAAEITARKVREARDFLEVPIAVENVSSYAEFHVSEMTEWEFLNEVVERADCGILLDVNNIYVSSQNHSFDPYDYLNSVPADRVAQIHIAGHSKFEKYILDTHDHPVLDPVWKLYEHAIRRIGPTATLLEWDDRIPSFDEVHAEARKAEQIHRDSGGGSMTQSSGIAAARCRRGDEPSERFDERGGRSSLSNRTIGSRPPSASIFITGNIGIAFSIRSTKISLACARCSASAPSSACRAPI